MNSGYEIELIKAIIVVQKLNQHILQITFEMKRLKTLIAVLFLATSLASTADLIEVLPVTNRILRLEFDEGYVKMGGFLLGPSHDKIYRWPLDVESATDPSSYYIASKDDPAYSTPLSPLKTGRKSKIDDVSQKCKWDSVKQICWNDYVSLHTIYLVLPFPLKSGKTYTVNTGSLADNMNDWTFSYNITSIRSVAVHTNQTGYLPDAPKYAYISQWMGDLGPLKDDLSGNLFSIYPVNSGKTGDQPVFSGKVTLQKKLGSSPDISQSGLTPEGSFVGADVWQCDFSEFTENGEYILSVNGLGASFPFRIGPDVYYNPFYFVTRALYYERAVTALDEPYALKWPRPEWKNRKMVYTRIRTLDLTDESGNNQKKKIFDNFDRSVDLSHIHGWYHDAGDWDGYFSHFRVPRSLMIAYELTPESFRDGELNIPEAQEENGYEGTHIPDLLDEAVWLVDYFKHNVGPTGGIFGSRVEPDISDQSCQPEGMPSWMDCTEWIVFGEDPRDSYAFTSVAAEYAYCLSLAEKQTGEDYSAIIADYRNSALKAYKWAMNNTLQGDEQKSMFIENRMAASVWLYKLTGDSDYEKQFEKDVKSKGIGAETQDLGEAKWAVWAYVTIPETGNKTLKKLLIQATKNFADLSVTDAIDDNRSMRMGGKMKVPLNNGQATTPLIIPSMMAWSVCKTTGDPDAKKYYDACVNTTSYFLGNNPLNMVWMSGFGHNHPRYVFHLDSWYDQINEFIPGIVPYGPRVLCDWFTPPNSGNNCDYNGPHDADFALLDGRLYPAYFNEEHQPQWPAHELWVENYRSVPADEFTVHQTIGPAAAAYGFLTAKGGESTPDQYPFVMIQSPKDVYQSGNDISLDLATADDHWVYSVKFYAGEHFIGSAEPGAGHFIWHEVKTGEYTIHAVAEDNIGLRTTSAPIHIIVK